MSIKTRSADPAARALIDGASVDSGGDASFEAINPSTGRGFISVAAGCDADADRAVSSTRKAFESGQWSEAPISFRKKVLHRFADLIAGDAAALDALDAEEMGKPVSVAYSNAHAASDQMRFYAEACDKLAGEVYQSDKSSLVTQRRVPRGVIAAIVPWNFPTGNAVLKIAPALAAGNCLVLKPSELSSRSAIRLGHLAVQAGLPPGVLNVLPGLGKTVGRALALHMDVDMIAFTGSTATGKQMLQYAGQSNLKNVMVECGGKSAQIVFNDGVDLDAAANWIAGVLLTNQGQWCSVGSRLLVHRSIERTMSEKIIARLKEIVAGDALDPKTTFGPLASSQQCERVMGYIRNAPAEGAELLAGGKRLLESSGGYFVEPTVFGRVGSKMRIAQEEIFGPVLSIIPFDDEAEAIRLANDTVYGLSAYVWTASLSTGMRMAKGIRSSVLVNAALPGEGAGHAFALEPTGQSGIGVEGGLAGMETYLHRQLVWFSHP